MFKIILFYYVLAIVYILFYYFRKKRNWLIQLVILLFCPIIGILLLFEMNREYKVKSRHLPKLLIQSNDGIAEENVLLKPDFVQELSVVPISDTLILNNDTVKRRSILNLLKQDTIDNVDILSNALLSEDTETSHYAATAIMEIKRKMLNSIHSMEKLTDNGTKDIEILNDYAEALRKYIYSNLLDMQSKKIYLYKYSSLLETIIEQSPLAKQNYMHKIDCDLELNELDRAESCCKMFLRYCGNEEDSYFYSMKFYYLIKDRDKFYSVMNQLKESSVKISPEGIKIFRFWLNGMGL